MWGVYNKQGRYLGVRISIHDISKLKDALGHIQKLETGKEFENLTKIRLKNEIAIKEQELVSFLLQLSQKNELVLYAVNQLESFNKKRNLLQIKEIINRLRSGISYQLDWKTLESKVNQVHPNFLNQLNSITSKLTLKEKKLCIYIRLDLSSKEIAGLQNITDKSVEIAQVRLRKKLNPTNKKRLSKFLSEL